MRSVTWMKRSIGRKKNFASEAGPFSAQCCEAVLVLSHNHHDWWTGQRQDDDAKVYLRHLPGSVPVKRDPFWLHPPVEPAGECRSKRANMPPRFTSALGLVTEEDSPLNDTEMLSADLIVVDEFSMVDMRLAYVLLERIKPGAQLIIVGDADQLPSVGAGNVLREMIRSEKVPTAVWKRYSGRHPIVGSSPTPMQSTIMTHIFSMEMTFRCSKCKTRKMQRSWS